MYPTGKEKDVIFNVAGQWTKNFDIHTGPAKHNGKSSLIESWDPAQNPTTELTVAPIEKQHPLESRRAWAKVAAGIAKADLDAVGREKSKIENAQREARAQEKAEGRIWQRRFFSLPDSADPVLAQLGPAVGLAGDGEADKTGGIWRFDREKAEKAWNEPPLSEEDAASLAKELLGQ